MTFKSWSSHVKKSSDLLWSFSTFFLAYIKRYVVRFGIFFEKQKNVLVRFFAMKRGRYNRPFLHITAMGVMIVGVMLAPFLADTFPIFSATQAVSSELTSGQQSVTVGENVFQTAVSEKPRDKAITYVVERGDTLLSIAKKFGVSPDTVKWANDLKSDSLSIGDELQILPVTGISHKVQKGDTIYSIAKKYDVNAQKIVDFPFNDFANPETFSLIEGQIIMVPDGVKPSERPITPRQIYIAQGPVPVAGGGFTWPLRGEISQFPAWYHMALDIAAPIGTPIASAHNGTVTKVLVGAWDGGYGTSVYVDNGAGVESHYAHLSGVNVSVGDTVFAGRTVVGWVGMTGRTTGPHVHFEIRRNGVLVNPLSYLQ